jgi:hypothetical protein
VQKTEKLHQHQNVDQFSMFLLEPIVVVVAITTIEQ